MASYFSYFPNVYVGEGVNSDEGFKYRLVKNIFRRLKARDDLDQYSSTFEAYSIQNNETPSSLAYKIYQDSHLDWVILLVNNITDVYDGWPKGEEALRSYVEDLYDDPDSIHHYETNEILFNNIVYIPKNRDVDESFRAVMPDGTTKTAEESRFPVTNYEYEYYLNEKKRLIKLPSGYLVDLMITEMKQLLDYEPNVEVDEQGNKQTKLSAASRFINNDAAIIGSATNTGTSGPVTSFNNGPGESGTTLAGVATSTTTTTTPTPTPAPTPAPTPTPAPSPSPSPTPSDGGGGGGYGGY